MKEKEFESLLENNIKEREAELSISNMKLSAIFRKYYSKFRLIQLSYSSGLSNVDKEFSCYTKQIQSILTMAGKFQKDGNPISEFQIINEMYRESKRKGNIDAATTLPTQSVDNIDRVESPTSNLNSSGVVKVSPKNNKKVVALNNGEITPIKIDNIPKATHVLEGEIILYKKNKTLPLWNGYDEWSFNQFKSQASVHGVKINQLALKGLLTPRFNQEIIDYFNAWLNKAYVCEKLFD